MDNLGTHKVQGVRKPIEAAGAALLYLAPYSPDCSPIANYWSKFKTFLRAVKACTCEVLDAELKQAPNTVTASAARGWFRTLWLSLTVNGKPL